MKKLLALLLALCLVFSFTACSKDSDSGSSKKDDESAKTTANTYTTPLDLIIAVKNAKTYSAYEKAAYASYNDFCEDEIKAVEELRKKSSDYDAEEVEANFNGQVASLKEQYGDDYKYSYTVDSKEAMTTDELEGVKSRISNYANNLNTRINNYKNGDDDDKQEMADDMGISKDQLKSVMENYEKVYETMKNCDVTEGYILETTLIINGSKLEEPEKKEATIEVFKVNGRWMSEDTLL